MPEIWLLAVLRLPLPFISCPRGEGAWISPQLSHLALSFSVTACPSLRLGTMDSHRPFLHCLLTTRPATQPQVKFHSRRPLSWLLTGSTPLPPSML